MRARTSPRALLVASLLAAAVVAFVPTLASAQTVSGLTDQQISRIKTDLATIKSLGFDSIRLLTFTKVNDPAYSYQNWQQDSFLSFPAPTPHELENLKEFFKLVDDAGLSYELVLLMPDSHGLYYKNGVTGADYKTFIDALWTVIWTGKLHHLYVGGDLALDAATIDTQNPDAVPTGQNYIANHRRWIEEIWPYVNAKCPGCNVGIELYTPYGTTWGEGAASARWVRANLSPQPGFLGFQLYPPSTHVGLQNLGYETNGVVDWTTVARDFLTGVQGAAGSIPVTVDEIGLDLTPQGYGLSDQDQKDFFTQALPYFNTNNVPFNIWEFADHPGIGLFGLMKQNRTFRPAAQAITPTVAAAREAGLSPGIQYIPPESDDLSFVTPRAANATLTLTAASAYTSTNVANNNLAITTGDAYTIAWSARYATKCTLSSSYTDGIAGQTYDLTLDVDNWDSFTGASTGTHPGTYTLTCNGTNTLSFSKSVTITAVAAPTVALTASPTYVALGKSSTLTWVSTGATSCTGKNFTPVGTNSYVSVAPTIDTTYTITCANAAGSTASATAVVTISNSSPTATLIASPIFITLGQSSTLTYSSSNSVTSCTGTNFTPLGTSGSVNVTPTATTTYTITCANAAGSTAVATAAVVVSAATTTTPTVSIDQSTLTANSGTPTITGTATGLSTVYVTVLGNAGSNYKGFNSGAITVVNDKWSVIVSPALSDGTYTINATDSSGVYAILKSLTISTASNPTATLTVANTNLSIASITVGQSVTLNYSSTGATSCMGSSNPAGFALPNSSPSGSVTVTPTVTTSYDLICTSSSGARATGHVYVVVSQPPTATLTIDQSSLTSTSGTPTITGTVAGASTVYFTVNGNNASPTGFTSGPLTVVNGKWIVTVSPALPASNYGVQVTDGISGWAFGTLTISSSTAIASDVTTTMTASPTTINVGQSATLTWTSTNATSCTGAGFTPTSTNGSVSVTPTYTTAYTITCTGFGGSHKASAIVTVNPPITINISPFVTSSGAAVSNTATPTITGTANGPTSVYVTFYGTGFVKVFSSGPITVVNGQWSVIVSPALSDGTYTINATDSNGLYAVLKSLTISTQYTTQ